MCGRYYRRSDKQKIADHFKVRNDLSGFVLPDSDYNVAPTTFQPVIREARDTADREMVLMRWGLIPFFTKQLSDVKGITTINARAETVATAPTYREPLKRRRCIIPASGFYEFRSSTRRPNSPIVSSSPTASPSPSPASGTHGRNPNRLRSRRTPGSNPSPSSPPIRTDSSQ